MYFWVNSEKQHNRLTMLALVLMETPGTYPLLDKAII